MIACTVRFPLQSLAGSGRILGALRGLAVKRLADEACISQLRHPMMRTWCRTDAIVRKAPTWWRHALGAAAAMWLAGSSGFAAGAAPAVLADAGWRAAAARIKITPDSLMWMAGYARRTKPADGITLDLFAKALVAQDAYGEKLALVTVDLIGIPRSLRQQVAAEAERRHGIRPAMLVLNASHTHSGPELRSERPDSTEEPAERGAAALAYTRQVGAHIVDLLSDCVARLEPARLGYGFARCGFAMNRRTPTASGYVNRPYPPGPVDHQVPVLRVVNKEGRDLAIVFGYSCHNTTLGLQQFNGDYAGYAQQAIEAAHPGAVALFANGCSGDQNPYPRGTIELAETHGRTLAAAVEAALTTDLHSLTGQFGGAYEEIPLAYQALPSRAELEDRKKSTKSLDARHAHRMLALFDREGRLPTDYPYPVQVLRFGSSLTMVALGGEAVVDYALRLKREIADAHVWIAAYCNDVMTYIPSRRVLAEGGYEGGEAMKWGAHPSTWSDKVEEHIVSTVHRLRRSLEGS